MDYLVLKENGNKEIRTYREELVGLKILFAKIFFAKLVFAKLFSIRENNFLFREIRSCLRIS